MKIGQKLILAFVGITLCVGILIGYASIRVSQKALRENIEKAPLIYNDIITRSLDVFIYNLLSDFKDLATGYLVENTITASNELFSKVTDVQKYIDERQAQWTGIPMKVEEKLEIAEDKQAAKEVKEQEKKELKAELKEELKKEVTKELQQELKKALKAEVKKEAVTAGAKKEEKKEEVPPIVKEVMDNKLSKKLMGMAKNFEKTYEIENFGQILITNKYGANIASARRPANYKHDNEEWW